MDLSRAERRLLAHLPTDGTPAAVADVREAAGFAADAQVLAAVERPTSMGLVAMESTLTTRFALSPEGLRYKESGLPERRAVAAIAAAGGGLPMGALGDHLDKAEVPVAIGWLKRKGWATIEKGDGGARLVAGDAPVGPDEEALALLSDAPTALDHPGLDLLRGRGGVLVESEETTRTLTLTAAGRQAAADLEPDAGEEVNQVTPELLARWADMTPDERSAVSLRPFAFEAPVAPRLSAKPHPLSQLMAQVRRIFWQMGFRQIAGDYVESAFWNMDALFIPQDHPARELQDTFYLSDPAALDVDAEALARTADVHRTGGGTGSTGWGGAFDEEVSRRALLRTHTTNTTVRYLADTFGADDADRDAPHRVFGLGRVFRNETMDATHLPEFHQIEGIVTEPGATFDTLVGLCRHFFGALGFPEVRFRPAYFPYTEPSMEIEVHYNGKWMELGGCGVFRPEVTEPLGVPHPVLAWGFGLERLAMMRLGLKDIRGLYLSDVQWLQEQALL